MKPTTTTMRPAPAIFAQLYKVDEERRLVYGRAASEEPDHSDEVMDYESSKPLFQEWSAAVHKDSGGKSFGNVREMHQPLAVGKLTDIEFLDDDRAIDITVKVVDDAAWEKVLEGVYTGFSIGGKYVKRWEAIVGGQRVMKYTASPVETSLVDRPCMPSSKFFEVMKRDGSVNKQRFINIDDSLFTEQELTDMAKLLERAAGRLRKDWRSPAGDTSGIAPQATDADDKPAGNRMKRPKADPDVEVVDGTNGGRQKTGGPSGSTSTTKYVKRAYTDMERQEAAKSGAAMKDGSYPIHDRSDLHNAIQAFGRAKDKDKTKAHIKTRAKALGHETDLPDDWEKVAKRAVPAWDGEVLAKGTYAVGSLAQLISGLESWSEQQVWEDKAEGQEKPTGVASKVKRQVVQLLGLLAEYAEEEAEELDEATDDECQIDHGPTVLTMSEKLGDLFKRAHDALEKKGARNSKGDAALLQKLHDTAVALGADCGSAKITPIGKSTGDTHMRVRKGGIESEGPKRGSKIGNEDDSEHSANEEHDAEDGTADDSERRESKGGNVKPGRQVKKASKPKDEDDDDMDDDDEDDEDEDDEEEKPVKKAKRVAKRRDVEDEDDDSMSQADLAKMVATTVVATLQGLGIIEANEANEAPVRKRRRDEDDDSDLEKYTRSPRRPALFAVEKGGDTQELGKADGGGSRQNDGDPLELALTKRVAQPIQGNNGKMDVASTLIKHIHSQQPMRQITADGFTVRQS
jgi:hypothetical protein